VDGRHTAGCDLRVERITVDDRNARRIGVTHRRTPG
jgi:hypothetical protein